MFAKILFTMVAGLAASTLVHAQVIEAKVPFGFSVGKTVMQAGVYSFDTSVAPGVLRVRSQDWEKAVLIITCTAPEQKTDGRGKLVFNKYGEHYFLSRVVYAGGSGRELIKTAREKELLAQHIRPELRVLALK